MVIHYRPLKFCKKITNINIFPCEWRIRNNKTMNFFPLIFCDILIIRKSGPHKHPILRYYYCIRNFTYFYSGTVFCILKANMYISVNCDTKKLLVTNSASRKVQISKTDVSV